MSDPKTIVVPPMLVPRLEAIVERIAGGDTAELATYERLVVASALARGIASLERDEAERMAKAGRRSA